MRFAPYVFAIFLVTPAFAQQPTPQVLSLQQEIGNQLNSKLACSTELIAAAQELDKLKAELKALKAKPDTEKK